MVQLMFSRRHVMALAGGALLPYGFPKLSGAAEPVTTTVVLVTIAEAAAKYAAGKVIESILGDGSGVSNSEILEAIERSTADIKKHVSAEVRAAITENTIKEMEAAASSAHGKLSTYAAILPEDRPKYVHLLHDADLKTRDGIERAAKIGGIAMGAYSVMSSLQIVVAKAFFENDGKLYIFKKAADDFDERASYLSEVMTAFMKTQEVDNRLGQVTCTTVEHKASSGGFGTVDTICSVKADNEQVVVAGGPLLDHNYKKDGQKIRNTMVGNFQEAYSEIEANLAKPLEQVAFIWRETAQYIRTL